MQVKAVGLLSRGRRQLLPVHTRGPTRAQDWRGVGGGFGMSTRECDRLGQKQWEEAPGLAEGRRPSHKLKGILGGLGGGGRDLCFCF